VTRCSVARGATVYPVALCLLTAWRTRNATTSSPSATATSAVTTRVDFLRLPSDRCFCCSSDFAGMLESIAGGACGASLPNRVKPSSVTCTSQRKRYPTVGTVAM
jgi:hypothetical protein